MYFIHLLSCPFIVPLLLSFPVCYGFAWETGQKRNGFLCPLHDWILYSMGIPVPSIHLVSSFPGIFPFSPIYLCIVAFSPVLFDHAPLLVKMRVDRCHWPQHWYIEVPSYYHMYYNNENLSRS